MLCCRVSSLLSHHMGKSYVIAGLGIVLSLKFGQRLLGVSMEASSFLSLSGSVRMMTTEILQIDCGFQLDT